MTLNRKYLAFLFFLAAFSSLYGQPYLDWATRIQTMGYGNDKVSLAVGTNGKTYVTGLFTGNANFGNGGITSHGSEDVYVAQFNASGMPEWGVGMGGNYWENTYCIALDQYNNVYTAGTFTGPAYFGPSQLSGNGNNTYVCKISSSGTFIWAKEISTFINQPLSICTDLNGNVFVTGNDPSYYDIATIKLDPSGSLLWNFQIGGTGNDCGSDIKTDSAGNVFLTGVFSNTMDFDPGVGSYFLNSAGDLDVFVTKLDANGNFIWARSMGGAYEDVSSSISISSSGDLFIAGRFKDTTDMDPGVNNYTLISRGMTDIFIDRLDPMGNFIWAKQLGGKGWEEAHAVLDASNDIYISGVFGDTMNVDPAGVFDLISKSYQNFYLCKLDPNGTFIYAGAITGNGEIQAIAAPGANGDIFIAGDLTDSADCDPGIGQYSVYGSTDLFVCKWKNSLSNSVNELTEEYSLQVYPNPSTGKLSISSNVNIPDAAFDIYDVRGQLIRSGKIQGTGEIDLTGCPKGLYLLRLRDAPSSASIRLVIN